ncbi:MAG: TetR/AcrR family transcriptional regulator [Microscillaceae bacterium]|nr:TetR/AcrR family transcriptional regulator [Microscillaceae bacterium]
MEKINTKEKILKTALDLFNNEGVELVSLRQIARVLEISDGNLRYYFKSKEDLVVQLYENMLEEMEANLVLKQQPNVDLAGVLRQIRIGLDIQYKYKFILINLVEICRKIALIRKHYREATRRRNEVFHLIAEQLIARGYLREDSSPPHRQNIFTIYHILGNFWAIEADLQGETDHACIINYFFRVNSSLIEPYLTEKGKRAFEQYFAGFSASGH